VFDSDSMLSIAKTHDEIWLWGNLFMKGVETVRVGYYKIGQHWTHRFDQSFGLCFTANTTSAEDQMMKNMTEYIRGKIDLDFVLESMSTKVEMEATSPTPVKKADPLAALKRWKPAGYGHF